MTYTFPRRGRSLAAGQRSELTVIDLNGTTRVIFTADEVIEAPNWSADGKWLVFNAGGHLFRIAATGGTPRRVSNTHTTPFHYYLHGISPDGETLAYVAIEQRDAERQVNVFSIPSAGGPDTRLTDLSMPNDGPEYSPDGRWIYFNSELAASRPGHAQIFRMSAQDGSGLEQLTFDNYVNWFPHLSPDGLQVAVLSFPQGTTGHPADKQVLLRLMNPDGGPLRVLASFFGGQGTINVNSWAPDSRKLAYVAYPQTP